MKFKKTALAAALVSVAAVPVAHADVTLSGQVAILLGGSDADDIDAVADNPATPEDETVLMSQPGQLKFDGDDSSINLSATHTMNNGLTGYGNYRLDALLTDSIPKADAVRVGIKGGFGDIRIGDAAHPVKYGQVAGDILTDIGDTRVPDKDDAEEVGISYEGTFGPATIGVLWSPERNRDVVAAGVKFNIGGFSIGAGGGDYGDGENANGDGATRFAVGATYGIGGASLGLSFKDFDGFEAISAKVGYGIGAVSLALTYEAITADATSAAAATDGDNKIRFDIGYDMGGGMNLSSRINVFSDDTAGAANEDLTDYRVMITKTF